MKFNVDTGTLAGAVLHTWYPFRLAFSKLSFVLKLLSETLDCPSGWDGYGNSCYKFVIQSSSMRGLNWQNARSDCLRYRGDLVSIANQSEMSFIHDKSSKVWVQHYWIGLNDRRHENQFVWSDGTPFNASVYSNWRPGEPNDRDGEDCVNLYRTLWNDENCNKEYGYICERPKGIVKLFIIHILVSWTWLQCTVQSRFYEPPRETKIGSKNRRVREIGGKITVFDFGRETTFASSYREVWKTEGSRNRDSTVPCRCCRLKCVLSQDDFKVSLQKNESRTVVGLCQERKANSFGVLIHPSCPSSPRPLRLYYELLMWPASSWLDSSVIAEVMNSNPV